MKNKIKVLTIGDHPLAFSGVGTQTKYMIQALLDSGKFEVISLGGALDHDSMNPVKTEEYGDLWTIYPVKGYGTQDMIRSIIRTEKPDILWFMTDPRFWDWLWMMDNEIRGLIPMVYYHVWDNYPLPKYNKKFYQSNDHIVTISKVTDDIVKNVSPDVPSTYIPHAIDPDLFYKTNMTKQEIRDTKVLRGLDPNKKMFFWNSRNARRKQSGSLIFWFKDFLDEVGHDKAQLVMHTNTKDPNGQDLDHIIEELELTDGQVLFSRNSLVAEDLRELYNMADCTVCVSDAEGFGLSTLESLACGTPIITTLTGGPQEQVTDGENWFGIGLEPASKAIIGSQDIPYIYEDRLSGEDVKNALIEMLNKTEEEMQELSEAGLGHIERNYNFKDFRSSWVDLMSGIYQELGSWDTRKNYKPWRVMEVTK